MSSRAVPFLFAVLAVVIPAACALSPWARPEIDQGGAGGQGRPCNAPSHCPGEDTACSRRTCDDGFCGVALSDGVLDGQTAGDCVTRQCADGELVLAAADDPLDDDNDCTRDVCNDGEPAFEALPTGANCGLGAATHCDGEGQCVGCVGDEDCPADTPCADWSCSEDVCTMQPASTGTLCGDVRGCAAAALTLEDACDGLGACQDGGVTPCAPYACAEDGLSCATVCLEDVECCCGNECLVPGLQGYGECVPASPP